MKLSQDICSWDKLIREGNLRNLSAIALPVHFKYSKTTSLCRHEQRGIFVFGVSSPHRAVSLKLPF